jgi:hypothetical protein
VPIEEWPVLNPRQVSELQGVNIYTIEALAGLSDGNLHNVVEGRELREKAKRWLKAKDTTKIVDENAKLLARIDALERRLSKPAKKKREPRKPAAAGAAGALATSIG